MNSCLILADLEATVDRHWFGSESVLRTPVPAIPPGPLTRARRDRGPEHWTEPERIVDHRTAELLLPYHRAGALAFMTDRPVELRETAERRLEGAGLGGAPIHYLAPDEHPAHGRRRIVRDLSPALTIEDDRLVADFIAADGHETLLLDDRYNRGPVRSIALMRIARADLAAVLRLRLGAHSPELDRVLVSA